MDQAVCDLDVKTASPNATPQETPRENYDTEELESSERSRQ